MKKMQRESFRIGKIYTVKDCPFQFTVVVDKNKDFYELLNPINLHRNRCTLKGFKYLHERTEWPTSLSPKRLAEVDKEVLRGAN